jgi:hypothetical protein
MVHLPNDNDEEGPSKNTVLTTTMRVPTRIGNDERR